MLIPLRTKVWMPPHGVAGGGERGHFWVSGERFSSCTSLGLVCGIEDDFFRSYSDSLVGDSPCSSIRSVVTLICSGESSARLVPVRG